MHKKQLDILKKSDFQLLLLATIPPVLGTGLVSPILDSLIEPFGTSPANISLMISVFTAPAIVLTPSIGLLADRFGRKWILVSALLIFGVAGVTIAIATDYLTVLLLRFIQGIGWSGINPVVITSIGDRYDGDIEMTGQGLRFTVSGLSGSVIPLIAGVVVVISWQSAFLLYTISIVIAPIVYFGLDQSRVNTTRAGTVHWNPTHYIRNFSGLLLERRVMAMIGARTLMSAVFISFITYNSIIVIRLIGRTSVQAGLLATLGYVIFSLTASQSERIVAIFKRQYIVLIGANVAQAIGFGFILFAPDFVLALLGITVFGIGFGLTGSQYRSIVTSLAPTHLRGGLVGMAEGLGKVTQTLTPLAMGWLIGYTAPVYGTSFAIRLAGLAVTFIAVGGSITCLLVYRFSSDQDVEYRCPS